MVQAIINFENWLKDICTVILLIDAFLLFQWIEIKGIMWLLKNTLFAWINSFTQWVDRVTDPNLKVGGK